jgi:hypothetical protein
MIKERRIEKMKTTLIVEIESKDTLPVLYEEGDVEEEYNAEQKKDLPGFQKKFAKEVHQAVINAIKNPLNKEMLEETIMDSSEFEECYVESWDNLKDYGIKVKVKRA